MTIPDAATEALAEVIALISLAAYSERLSSDHKLNAMLFKLLLRRRGYVIRKARKSG